MMPVITRGRLMIVFNDAEWRERCPAVEACVEREHILDRFFWSHACAKSLGTHANVAAEPASLFSHCVRVDDGVFLWDGPEL